MITTVTLNLSVDKLYLVTELQDYTVMRVKQVSNTAGGKGLNVSRVASLLGEEVTALGFAGGFNGDFVRQEIENQGIKASFTRVKSQTRCCVNVRDSSTGKHTEFLEPGAPVTKDEQKSFLETYRKQLSSSRVVAISGSVPQGVPVDFYGTLTSLAKEEQIPVIVDTSGALLHEVIKAKPTMIKPNVDELGQLLGKKLDSLEEAVCAAVSLQQSGIPYVAVSLGKHGAILACKEGVFRGTTPDIPVVNTVGCGDSMVAGFAVSMSKGLSAKEMLRLAIAVSTANALHIQTGYFEQESFDKVLPLVEAEKIR